MIKKIFLLFFLVSASVSIFAQHKKYTVADAHAHNDYMHPVPFYTAWNAGFGSIEADVFPVNGVLLVSHNKEALDPKRTLDSLYLNPLLKELRNHPHRKVNLLVDIKEDYKNSLAILLQELKPLKKYLVSDKNPQNLLTILISGERPPPAEYKNYPGYIFFDDDLKIPHSPEEWKRVGLVSLSFQRYSQWNGEGEIPGNDKQKLLHVIDSVHQAGKKIRFWAAPDNQNSWLKQMELNVDLIGTDKIQELSEYIKMN
ncbi:MAG TPA: phosphatidylinositol-specific phospholipase C/glycerophosphodiester phosphodiesterase family protein [Hanamia sp.]|nr:phosphatidylinositol-specific phospholipase C/glycerophosphodiester phosphodiesterase family protein [Hanamia sp.]